MKNEDLEKHINALKVLIEKEQYEEVVGYYVDNIYSDKSTEKDYLLKDFSLKYKDQLLSKNNPETLLLLGILDINLRDYDQAIIFIDKAIRLNVKYAKAYNYKGNAYFFLKKYDIALNIYTKAIQIDDSYSPSYNNRGIIYYKLKNYNKALEDYAKAIKLNDSIASTYNNRGNTYRNLMKYNKANEDFDKAIVLDPSYALAYYNKGLLCKEKKQYKEALRYFTRHNELVPNIAEGYFQQGEIYVLLEDVGSAIKNFTTFSKLTKDDYWKARALEQIKELKEEKENVEIKKINGYVESIKDALLFKETLITHYTSIEGAKVLLLNSVSSFRMSEANYMNDTTEGERLKEAVIRKENFDGLTKISYIEKPFLGSFVDDEKCNDLTLWRMYAKSDGIDGRGCAITLDKEELIATMMETFIDKEYLKNNTEFSSNKKEIENTTILTNKTDVSTNEFGFYKVAYLNEKGKCIGRDKVSKNVNKALEGLKISFENILNKDDKELLKIALTRLSEIEYLFKGIEYQHESEVRLILSKTGKGKHIKVDTSDYFEVPRVYLNIGNILSAVKSITIGPKVERPKEWASAFNYNFLEKGMKESKVYISRLPYK